MHDTILVIREITVNPKNACRIYKRNIKFATAVSADDLEPKGAKSSAAVKMTT